MRRLQYLLTCAVLTHSLSLSIKSPNATPHASHTSPSSPYASHTSPSPSPSPSPSAYSAYLAYLGSSKYQMKPTSLIESAWTEPILGSDKLSHEIFSILESRFLFGPLQTLTLECGGGGGRGRVRILSIDGGGGSGGGGGELAAAAMVRLEARLRELSGNPSARIVDFFDLAAGAGAGAVLAAALFARGLSAADAADALALIQSDDRRRRRRRLRWVFGRRSRAGSRILDRVFGETTMRDAAKPLLIPCYDASTGAPYVFSRADAVEGDAYDFFLRDVCSAACGGAATAAAAAVSVDGATRVLSAAAAGAMAMASPAAAAVTHVLHNKQEFPFVAGVADLFVVSIGNGGGAGASEATEELLRIAGAAQADIVDQALAFAFGESRSASYVRIQGDGITGGRTAEETLAERSVESVLFRGRRMTETTNGERLDWAARELAKEEERRRRSKTPMVLIKPAAVTPRTSSSTSSEITVTTVSGASSASL